MGIFATIIVGAIIGALARFFMKGDQNIGVLWTVILGAGGTALGWWLVEGPMGSDSTILKWIVSIVLAIVLISLYLGVSNRGASRRR
ncbi:GlsB/YeaQ/YmgE family stress response membrane protein [Flaviflexus equikiangi]|uniref:GlsB/YeaQ/YmgE family stress response membrane protein n=1 Tax=Flaviflexus equikiangi TaxID=2758573 RepID=A0ABS2TG88_9ACTO|nr:GlsB/YeaQ/YmgE family stress response membrane protein [Flaviflexus equikiangi]MBM9433673.1 GlsB/YeaQ/YmgE family stress response membrane protein [Flaviflexus equikiangi]